MDLTGKTFGTVTIIKRIGRSASGMHTYQYKCACGNEAIATGSSIKRSGKCKKCGQDAANKKKRKEKGHAGFRMVFNNYKARAKRDDIEFKLTFDEFKSLVVNPCHYCGESPNQKWKASEWAEVVHNGLDRKNPMMGYELDNCLPCCKTCNFGKNDLTYDEWLNYLDRLVKFRMVAA